MFKSVMLDPSVSLSTISLSDPAATEAVGVALAKMVKPPLVIYVQGELGVGKTTLIRGFLTELGFKGAVKSPTYTLVEEYEFSKSSPKSTESKPESLWVYHFDLYRLSNAEELEFMGIREYFHDQAIVWIEWPEQGKNFLPSADIVLQLSLQNEDTPMDGRLLKVTFLTERSLMLKSVFNLLSEQPL